MQAFDVLLSAEVPGLRRHEVRFCGLTADGSSSNPTWEVPGTALIAYRFRVSIRAERGGAYRVEVPWALVNRRGGRPPVPDAARHTVYPGTTPGFLLRVGESSEIAFPVRIDGELQPKVVLDRSGGSHVPSFSLRVTLLPATMPG